MSHFCFKNAVSQACGMHPVDMIMLYSVVTPNCRKNFHAWLHWELIAANNLPPLHPSPFLYLYLSLSLSPSRSLTLTLTRSLSISLSLSFSLSPICMPWLVVMSPVFTLVIFTHGPAEIMQTSLSDVLIFHQDLS